METRSILIALTAGAVFVYLASNHPSTKYSAIWLTIYAILAVLAFVIAGYGVRDRFRSEEAW